MITITNSPVLTGSLQVSGFDLRAPGVALQSPVYGEKTLSDRSDVILQVPKCSKFQNFLGSAPDPAKVAYSAPLDPVAGGEGHAAPSQQPPSPSRSRPFGPRFYGSQGLTHYRIGNPTSDIFQM